MPVGEVIARPVPDACVAEDDAVDEADVEVDDVALVVEEVIVDIALFKAAFCLIDPPFTVNIDVEVPQSEGLQANWLSLLQAHIPHC